MSPLRIEPDAALLPPGWCWCGHIWMIAGLPDFVEGGLLHRRVDCLPPRTPTTLSPADPPGG